jgi:hypothetical protein
VTRSKALVDSEKDTTLAHQDEAVDEGEDRAHLAPDGEDLSSDASVDCAEEDDGNELEVDQKLTQVRDFLLESHAYASLRAAYWILCTTPMKYA